MKTDKKKNKAAALTTKALEFKLNYLQQNSKFGFITFRAIYSWKVN